MSVAMIECVVPSPKARDESVTQLFPFTEQMTRTDRITLAMLIAEMAAHDHEVYAHAQRILPLAEAVARRLNLSSTEILHTCTAALLHDIGKRGVPDAVLHKAGPLNDDEWVVMRTHTEIGYTLLAEQQGIFTQIAYAVLTHHERWDGLGYPLGLMGEEIPLIARIIAVIDSYDAMTSIRLYKGARTHEETCMELQRCVGTQYDPCVIEAALPVLHKLCTPATLALCAA